MTVVSRTRVARWLADVPRWALIVAAVVAAAFAVSTVSAVEAVEHGLAHPWVSVAGVVAVFATNYLYVTIVRQGDVLEAIDLSEAPAVALTLLLPAPQVVLVVLAGSFLGELRPGRSTAKKAFNVGIRTIGVACLAAIAGHDTLTTPLHQATALRVVLGAAVYTAVGIAGVASVVAAVGGESVLAGLAHSWHPRLVAWAGAVTLGFMGAALSRQSPWALVGLVGVAALLRMMSIGLARVERERDRLQCVLDATALVLDATDDEAREHAVLDAARRLLVFCDVTIGEQPPGDDEAGAVVHRTPEATRWVVAHPLPGANPWSAHDEQTLAALGKAATAAFDRVRLERELGHLANIDPLTHLANRRSLDAQMTHSLATAGATAVLALDLDGFKPVNDRLGHAAGDYVLKVVAARLSHSVRSTDVVSRTGGDEFVVVLEDTDLEGGYRVAEKIRAAIEQPISIPGWRLSISASIGVASTSEEGSTATTLLRRADERMYAAKRAGRDGEFVACAAPAAVAV